MNFASILDPNLIKIEEVPQNKESILIRMIEEIKSHYQIPLSSNDILKEVLKRESLGDTLINGNIWLPHARLPEFNDIIVSITIPRNKLLIDKSEIQVIVLVLVSPSTSTMYLNILSAISRIASRKDILNTILNISKPEEVVEIIRKENIAIKKEISIIDIMQTDYPVAKPEMSIDKLIDMLFKHNSTYAPVLDSEGKFIGDIHIKDILKKGLPNYTELLSNLSFLPSLTHFEQFLEKENELIVKEIMKKPSITFKEDTTIIEATMRLVENDCMTIPILNTEGFLIGIINCKDILKKVLRM